MSQRDTLSKATRLVVKVGSALLTDDGLGLNAQFILKLASQISELRAKGVDVVLVSSGSIAAGLASLKIERRPTQVNVLQAAAAVGQASLIRHYQDSFAPHNVMIAQVLLTHADIANRERYLNARNTFTSLLELGVVPIVNENDTVATEEICFGDNDSLAALVGNLIDAQALLLLTDQDGLYTADPRTQDNAELVSDAVAGDESLLSMATGGSSLGRGGMVTKLQAATIAARSGAATVIANGRVDDVITRVLAGESIGTFLRASDRMPSRKQWMANQMRISGAVVIDSGAVKVLTGSGRSLLPVGVTSVEGEFERGSLVVVKDPQGREIGRGLINYSSKRASSICGLSTQEVRLQYGELSEAEMIHRDHLVILEK